jgi:hypothetical protein
VDAPKLKPAVAAGVVEVSGALAPKLKPALGAGDGDLDSVALAVLPNRLEDWKTDAGFAVSASDAAGFAPKSEAEAGLGASDAAGWAPNSGLAAGFEASGAAEGVAGLAPKIEVEETGAGASADVSSVGFV